MVIGTGFLVGICLMGMVASVSTGQCSFFVLNNFFYCFIANVIYVYIKDDTYILIQGG